MAHQDATGTASARRHGAATCDARAGSTEFEQCERFDEFDELRRVTR